VSTVVGLTGGIGSGKSTVSAMLIRRGAVVIDADVIAREVVEPGKEAYEEVVRRFGDSVKGPDGGLDRPALAAIVFADASARADLEAIVHPAVGAVLLERLAAEVGTDHVVVLDIPLLVEAGGRRRYPLAGVLVVDAPEDIALERLVVLRGMPEEAARARVAAQAAREERLRLADFVILNIGTLDELEEMVERAWEWIAGLRRAA
jgi:dephospho-CoA kinase